MILWAAFACFICYLIGWGNGYRTRDEEATFCSGCSERVTLYREEVPGFGDGVKP